MMKEFVRNYKNEFTGLLGVIEATDSGKNALDTAGAIKQVCALVIHNTQNGSKVFFIGNGGSAGIASHMAVDFWKNGSMPALAFNDGVLLTCISNDFGYPYVFQKPVEAFAKKEDVLFAISSSGSSENILQAAKSARTKGCVVITLSGFLKDNPLRSLGAYNFYVPASKYGFVETAHQYLCHLILDAIIYQEKGGGIVE